MKQILLLLLLVSSISFSSRSASVLPEDRLFYLPGAWVASLYDGNGVQWNLTWTIYANGTSTFLSTCCGSYVGNAAYGEWSLDGNVINWGFSGCRKQKRV